MYDALLIKSDADSAMKIKSMLDTRFSNISMILQADSLSQTILSVSYTHLRAHET